MEIKKGIYTTEFWITLLTTIVSLAGTMGFLTPDQADTLTQNITQVIGGVIAIVSVLRYIKSRENVKIAGMNAEASVAASNASNRN